LAVFLRRPPGPLCRLAFWALIAARSSIP
jgi:hypothetical protein